MVKELQRLLPGAEPGQVLRSDPSWLLRCGRGCSAARLVQGTACSYSRAACTAPADHSGWSHAAALQMLQEHAPLSVACVLSCDCMCMNALFCWAIASPASEFFIMCKCRCTI